MRRLSALTFLSGLLMLVFSFGVLLTRPTRAGELEPLFRTPVYATATSVALTQAAATAQAVQPAGNGVRVYDNLRDLVIFRYDSGDLAYYRLASEGGGFHSWMLYPTWANATPGATVFDRTDEWGYRITLTRLTDFQVNAIPLGVQPDPTGKWFQVAMFSPAGTTSVSDYLYLIP